MSAMPQKIRAGVVELRTHSGLVYVTPSFWERIYLLWTFRNFHSLPRQVLNRHQQQLIERLCRRAIVTQNVPIAGSAVIGAVENVYLVPEAEAAAPTSKLVRMNATEEEVPSAQAVGSERISRRSNRAAYIRTAVERLRRQSSNVQCISAPKQDSREQRETKEASPTPVGSHPRSTGSRNRLGWVLATACSATLLGLLFYLQDGRLAPAITVPQVAIEPHKPSSTSAPAPARQPEQVQPQMPAERSQQATAMELRSNSAAVSFRQPDRNHPKTASLAQPSPVTKEPAPPERLHVAEAPESGFRYPVAPSSSLTGKVSLKAVIGTDGIVKEVAVLSGNHALARAAMRAVRSWRYSPPKLKGNAVEAETNIVISFVGADAVSISFPAAQ